MPALLLLSGPSAGLRFNVETEVTLGRSPACEIPLEDSKVSRRHAKVVVEDGQARITDLGSRNGTVVNGERIEGEAILLPGDRVQVGDSVVLFEPPAKASLADREAADMQSIPVAEVLPAVGADAALYSAGVALLSATSESMVLRRAAEELVRGANADLGAALLGGVEGLLTASVVGADAVEVPRSLARAALDRKEVGCAGGLVCAPLSASGGLAFGVLFAERREPFTRDELKVAAALGRLAGEALSALRSQVRREDVQLAFVGSTRQFRKTVEQARRAAAGKESVVIWGEPGTGKKLTAEYIHQRSPRALGPLVVIDCRELASVEVELFGRASAPGLPPIASALLRADGGTLVLQHVQALPRGLAERLGRMLIKKVAPAPRGGEEPVDVRLIATARAPLKQLVGQGEVDAELASVLEGNEIELLPLRERRPDVPALFELFAGRVVKPLRREPPTLSPEAKRALSEYAWPGNVRELELVAERVGLLHAGVELSPLQLPPEIQEGGDFGKPRTLQQRIEQVERDAIAHALREARGKKIKAAALLGISRPTLDKKIEDYQLVVEKVRKGDGE